MRLYTFTNAYISSIQKGIQSAHLAVDLVRKYAQGSQSALVKDWADNHKTMIVLNGGNSAMLLDLLKAFEVYDSQSRASQNRLALPFVPYACFREDEQSLNGALTCVGCVLPEALYSIRLVRVGEFTHVFGLPQVKPEVAVILPDDFVPSKKTAAQMNLAYLLATAKRMSLAN